MVCQRGGRSYGMVVVVAGLEPAVHLRGIRHDDHKHPQMKNNTVQNHHEARSRVPTQEHADADAQRIECVHCIANLRNEHVVS